jgi:ABC-type multidrug transport system fused ATPase/permease subunit
VGEEAIENIVSTLVLNIVPTFTQVIFSLIAITWYSPLTALLCLAAFIIAILWTNYFSNFHRKLLKVDIEKWDLQKKIRTETFQHLNLVKTSGVEKEYLKKYIDRRFELIKSSVQLWTYSINHGNKRWAFFSLARFLATLELIREATQGRILVGGIYAVWSWLNDTFSNIQNVIQAMRRIPLRFVELEKYLELIDREPEFEEGGIKRFEFGNIYFEHLNFKYPKSEIDVISDLNIEIIKGQKTAFVGFSGSGKSTIIKLLLRIYDWDSGDIKIGPSENMKSLRQLDTQVLRQKIGYVEQHVDLFDTTIRENILFGIQASSRNHKDNKNFNPELIDEVVHKSRIDQFFHRLGADGLDTLIGERGVKLSGGERQRIGIARALVKNPEILIFDEATASLDTENEKYIQEAIDESSKGRTTIIIAHRLSTIQNADKIFVMDKGIVVGQGTHEFLKNTCEVYQRLIHAQNS